MLKYQKGQKKLPYWTSFVCKYGLPLYIVTKLKLVVENSLVHDCIGEMGNAWLCGGLFMVNMHL